MYKLLRQLAILIVVLFAVGCVRSLHPIYTSSNVVFNDNLIGTWRQSNEETTWQFTASTVDDRDRAYRLVLTDDKGGPGTFLAHLVKLDDELYLDLFPIAPQVANNGIYKFHFQRVHTFLHVGFDGKTLTLAAMSPEWLESYLQENPDALPHTMVTPQGHAPTGNKNDAAERLLLTATTPELQRFIQKHVDTKGAFGDPVKLTRIH